MIQNLFINFQRDHEDEVTLEVQGTDPENKDILLEDDKDLEVSSIEDIDTVLINIRDKELSEVEDDNEIIVKRKK